MTVYSNPESWGPPAWVFLHCISLTYPKKPSSQDKLHYKQFFESLVHVLPCPACRREYETWTSQHPIDPHLSSRTKLANWVIDLHNNVNLRKQRPRVNSKKDALNHIKKDCKKYATLLDVSRKKTKTTKA